MYATYRALFLSFTFSYTFLYIFGEIAFLSAIFLRGSDPPEPSTCSKSLSNIPSSLSQRYTMALNSFTTEAFTLLAVGTIVVLLRTYTRMSLVGIRRFMLDDYLMILAVVSS